ncbi:MAG: IPT/TIG domain-containing protein, partial [Thermoanaerobaculia bacterium]
SSTTPVVDSTVTITANVTQNGQPVPNGTAVQFTATEGAFDSAGSQSVIKTTTNGIATVALTSSVAQTITVRAVVGNAQQSVNVTFRTTPVVDPPPNTAPTITAVTPSIGTPAGGQRVIISGTNFTAPLRVLFDIGQPLPVEAFIVSSTANSIEVLTPGVNLGAGQQLISDVIVITQFGTANEQRAEREDAFTFRNEQLQPNISTASPNSGPVTGGTRVTIFGDGFQAPVQVLFGAAEARVITVEYSQIIVEAPAGRDTSDDGSGPILGPVDITVRNINSALQDTMGGGFRYVAAIQITAAGPTRGPATGGTRVEIEGNGFVAPVAVTIGTYAAQPIFVSGTKVIAITSAADIEGCADIPGPITVTNIVNGDQAIGPIFTYDAPEPIIVRVQGPNPTLPGSTITVTVINAGLFPQIEIGDTGATITGSSSADGGLTTNFTVTVPLTVDLETEACPSGGTRQIPTSFDVTFTNPENDCTITVPDGLTVQPQPIGRMFVTPNPLTINATGDDPSTPADEEADGSGTFTIVNTGAANLTITGITSNNPNFSPDAGSVGLTLAPCESTVVAVTYEAGATGSTETATITVSATSAAQVITARETVVGRTQ